MILLVSPAKSLNYDSTKFKKKTEPRFQEDSRKLINILKKKSVKEIRELMHVSEKIADLNVRRYKSYKKEFNFDTAKQAVLAFTGDVYQGMNVSDFDSKDLAFAQKHLRILSGLYGVLRPLDLMQPYRLEMGTKLQTKKGKNLYEFWNDKVANILNEDLKKNKDDIYVNLASKEYFNVLKRGTLDGKMYTMHFKENRNGVFKIIAFSAKRARGMMCNFVIKNRIKNIKHLKGFDQDSYVYNPDLSNEFEYTFTR